MDLAHDLFDLTRHEPLLRPVENRAIFHP